MISDSLKTILYTYMLQKYFCSDAHHMTGIKVYVYHTWSYEGGVTAGSGAEVSNFLRSVCDWPVLYRSNRSYRKNTLFKSSLILKSSSEKKK